MSDTNRKDMLEPSARTRALSVEDAAGLPAGAHHYRAFVGPPDRFDFMSATQFSLLFQLGLRDFHKVLDIGCGSLRLGRLLIPYLRPGGYFGIDPNRWLIEDGLERELGRSAADLKKPRFAYDEEFDCTVFGECFDFIMAQSIVTHAGPDLSARLFSTIAHALRPDGICLFSYIRNDSQEIRLPAAGWHYPGCIEYSQDAIAGMLDRAGLVGTPIPWYHPAHAWHVAGLSEATLPSREHLSFLSGVVLRSAQFSDSIA